MSLTCFYNCKLNFPVISSHLKKKTAIQSKVQILTGL